MAVIYYSLGAIPRVRVQFLANTGFIVFATIIVMLRIVAQKTRKVCLWWDDCCIVACLFFTWSLYTIQIADAIFGEGQHLKDIPMEDTVIILKMLIAYQVLYGTAQALAKLSYLLFYLRIFINSGFVLAVQIMIGVVLCWLSAIILQAFLICRPFNANWDISIRGSCDNRPFVYTANGAVGLITDVVILLLPVPTVLKLQMPLSTKLGIIAIFAIGLNICMISVIRMHSLYILNFADITYEMLNPVSWTVLEPSLAIISACLPIVRHLVKPAVGKGWFKLKSKSKAIKRTEDVEGNARLTEQHAEDGMQGHQFFRQPLDGCSEVCSSSHPIGRAI